MMKKGWFIVLFAVGLALVLLYQYQKYRVVPSVDLFKLPYTDTSGKQVDLNSYKGKKIVYSFFGTWCGECLMELKELNEVRKTNLEDIEIIVVSDESNEKIRNFARKKKYPFTFLELQKNFDEIGVNAIPLNYLVNTKGEVVYSKLGSPNWKDPSVISMVEESVK
jgi:peroxiredoxin